MPPFARADMSALLERGTEMASRHLNQLQHRSISSTVLTGHDPTMVDADHPITLFIIQLIIIIAVTQSLGWAFKYIKQPAVIAEVIAGILLGPTAFGRIPNFTNHIFPKPSITYLNLVANIGLVLFLFLIGVEVDVSVMKRNGKAAALVSVAGMILPFGLGAACAIPTYNNFVDTDKVSFGHFMLFVGVAMAITAFPVLCRILSSTKLLDTRVGMIVLAAGVGNDVVGWVLLALTLALVNGGGGATAGYMLLASVAWAVILLWPIKKAFIWACHKTGSLEGNGPTIHMMNITLVIVFISAFVTGILGVHPIFGAFLAGLIIPHEGGFAIALVEKIDDLVALLFLPIYFVLSGLSTNLGLINDGLSWGYIVLFCAIGWFGKFAGCAVAARFLGYTSRESGAIGMLMSCKGLVELIVLNVGYQAGIIDQRLFSMFVLVAVILTFITTPCTILIYPEKYRIRGSGLPRPIFRKDKERRQSSSTIAPAGPGGREITERFLVVLQKVEHLSAVMFISQLLEPSVTKTKPLQRSGSAHAKAVAKLAAHTVKGAGEGDISDESNKSSPSRVHSNIPSVSEAEHAGGIRMDALKLIELTGRTYSVMQSAEKDSLLLSDDTLQLFKQYGRLRGFEITPHLDIVATDSYHNAVADLSQHIGAELVLIPWTIPHIGEDDLLVEPRPTNNALSLHTHAGMSSSAAASPVASIFGRDAIAQSSSFYSDYVRKVFNEATADVALFVDRGFGASSNFTPGAGQHIFMPFFGGADDRLALRFVVQLCANEHVTATVVRFERDPNYFEQHDAVSEGEKKGPVKKLSMGAMPSAMDSPVITTKANPASEAVDAVAWKYYAEPDSSPKLSSHIPNSAALSRMTFHTLRAQQPLAAALENCQLAAEQAASHHLWRPLLVVTGRGRRGAVFDHADEVRDLLSERERDLQTGMDLRKTVGDVGAALIMGGGRASAASFLVLESGQGKSSAT